MGDKRDGIRYKKAVQRVIEKWQDDTEKKLVLDLDSITDDLEKLDKIKNPSAEEKKQLVDLGKAARSITEKRLKARTADLQKELGKVKPPETEGDGSENQKMVEDLNKDLDKGITVPIPEAVTDKFKWAQKVVVSVDIDDVKGVRAGFKF